MKPQYRLAILLVVLLSFVGRSLWAQSHSVKGRVTDAQNRQPLAFVNIIANEGLIGTMSDINGYFNIATDTPIAKLFFSSIGYESMVIIIQPGQEKYNVALTPVTFELNEITVEAGENPAHRIIDSLMAHRKANNPNSLESYHYKIYDQMVFTIDSSEFGKAIAPSIPEEASLKKIDSILKQNDLMVMETASEVFFKSPDRKLQNVLGTKIAGLKEPSFFYLANSLQSISFYDDVINVIGNDYVNPISRNSKSHYFFDLESVNPIGHGDSLYVISFHPMHGSTFNGLRGTLTVNSDGWALQSVKAAPNEQNALFTANIQQLYQKVDSHWFPKQLNTNLVFSSMIVSNGNTSFPLVAVGKSYLKDIEINPDLSKHRFSEMEIIVNPNAAYRDDTFWNDHRIDSLTERIKATYIFVDSLTKGTNIFDRVLGFTSKLMDESALSVGPLDINLGNVLKLSERRGLYFGLEATTNDHLSRFVRLNAFGGYWTKMKGFDYGGGIKLLLNRQKQMELGLRFTHQSEALGEFGNFDNSRDLFSENTYRFTFYSNIDVRSNTTQINFCSRFAKHFKGFANLVLTDKTYLWSPFNMLPTTRFANTELKIRFAYKEKFISKPTGIRSLGTTYPIVWLAYSHSFPNIFGSSHEFDRIKFEATKNFYTKYLGVSRIMVQAGYASKSCPIMETFDLLGSYEPFGIYAPGSFGTMREHEFFCDRFVALHLSHNFNGMLWKTNSEYFKPELTIVTNMAWGDIRPESDYEALGLHTIDKGYYESGIIVKGLINALWLKIGAGVYYRYGAYAYDKVWDNFAFKTSITYSM